MVIIILIVTSPGNLISTDESFENLQIADAASRQALLTVSEADASSPSTDVLNTTLRTLWRISVSFRSLENLETELQGSDSSGRQPLESFS